MNDIIIIGADIEIIELIVSIGEHSIVGIIDKYLTGEYYGYKILGNDDFLLQNKYNYPGVSLVITLDDIFTKRLLYDIYKENEFSFARLISPKAIISGLTNIKEGAIIQHSTNVGPNVSIGKLTKINVKANLMHDAGIGDFNTIAPNAVTLGYVETGTSVFVGANATILPRCKIGSEVFIGAGAVVTKNLQSGYKYSGFPARKLGPIVKLQK